MKLKLAFFKGKKIDKLLDRLTKNKREKTQNTKIRNREGTLLLILEKQKTNKNKKQKTRMQGSREQGCSWASGMDWIQSISHPGGSCGGPILIFVP